jgi:2-dehydro-3-deoxyphosphooctonate aldolase (KDO 8-P synthase)
MNFNDLIGGRNDLFIIAGPCVLESDEIAFVTVERLNEICGKLNLPLIFKSSYDKANRTSIDSFRGPGIDKGLKILSEVKKRFSLPVLTDVHTPDDAKKAAKDVDVLQIPAFLCRQTDLIIAASETGIPVNIKRGQFLAPWDVKNIIDKFISTGNKSLIITERGVSFGYNNLVVDYRSFPIMKSFGYPVVFDVTHSLQLPGGQGTASGGQREFAEPLARAAVAAGADGLFLEVHPDPDIALCDGPNMIKLDDLEKILTSLIEIKKAISNG